MDLPYVVVLMIASCCTLFICINYLQVRSDMTTRMDNIKKLEQDLDTLKTENDTLQIRINTSAVQMTVKIFIPSPASFMRKIHHRKLTIIRRKNTALVKMTNPMMIALKGMCSPLKTTGTLGSKFGTSQGQI